MLKSKGVRPTGRLVRHSLWLLVGAGLNASRPILEVEVQHYKLLHITHTSYLGKNMFWRGTVLFVFLLTGHIAAAQSVTLAVVVIDENSVALRGVRVTLQLHNGQSLHCETGFAGRCQFFNLPAGVGELRAEKEGFYVMTLAAVQIGVTANVDITLTHVQEIKEVVNVVESPPAIDPAKTQA